MLRLIYVSFSAFLLLSTVGVQNVQGDGRVWTALRVFRALSPPQQMAVTESYAARSLFFIAGRNGITAASQVTVGTLAAAEVFDSILVEMMNGSPSMAMLTAGRRTELFGNLERELSLRPTGRNNVGILQESDFALPTDTANAVDVIAAQPLDNQEADELATQKTNFEVVIDAVRGALVNRAANFEMPQMFGRANRLHTHLTHLVNKYHIMLLGNRAEECVRTWDAPYNSAVNNLVTILLAVSPDTSTYSSAKDQMLKAMQRLFIEPFAELLRRLNIIADPVKCGMVNPQFATT